MSYHQHPQKRPKGGQQRKANANAEGLELSPVSTNAPLWQGKERNAKGEFPALPRSGKTVKRGMGVRKGVAKKKEEGENVGFQVLLKVLWSLRKRDPWRNDPTQEERRKKKIWPISPDGACRKTVRGELGKKNEKNEAEKQVFFYLPKDSEKERKKTADPDGNTEPGTQYIKRPAKEAPEEQTGARGLCNKRRHWRKDDDKRIRECGVHKTVA